MMTTTDELIGLMATSNVSSFMNTSNTTTQSEVAYITSRAVFIVILVIGLVSNCYVIAAIVIRGRRSRSAAGSTTRQRGLPSNASQPMTDDIIRTGALNTPPQLDLFLVGVLASANLIDCLVNAIWLITSAVEWRSNPYGLDQPWCRVNAAVVQLVSLAYNIGIALSFIDRYVAIRSAASGIASGQADDAADEQSKRPGFPLRRAGVLAALAWAYAIAFSVPLIVSVESGGLMTETDSARYLCTVDGRTSPVVYVWITAMVGYLCPFGVSLCMSVGCVAVTVASRRKSKRFMKSAYSASTSGPIDFTKPSAGNRQKLEQRSLMSDVKVSVEKSCAKYVATLWIAWCLLVGAPFLLLSFIRAVRWQSPTASPNPTIEPLTYSSDWDAIVVWLFVCHPVVLPLTTLFFRKSGTVKFSRCLDCSQCCQHDGSSPRPLTTSGSSSDVSSYRSWRRQNRSPKHRLRVGATSGCLQPSGSPDHRSSPAQLNGATPTSSGQPSYPIATIPILFATADGLHIQRPAAAKATSASLPSTSSSFSVRLQSYPESANPVGMIAVKCDVFGSFYSTDPAADDDFDSTSVGQSRRRGRNVVGGGVVPDEHNTSDYDSADDGDPDMEVAATVAAKIAVPKRRVRDKKSGEQYCHDSRVITVRKVSCAFEMEVRESEADDDEERITVEESRGQKLPRTDRDQNEAKGRDKVMRSKQNNDIDASKVAAESRSKWYDVEPDEGVTVKVSAPKRNAKSARNKANDDATSRSFPVLSQVTRSSVLQAVYGGGRKSRKRAESAPVSTPVNIIVETSDNDDAETPAPRKANVSLAETTETGSIGTNKGKKKPRKSKGKVTVAKCDVESSENAQSVDKNSSKGGSKDASSLENRPAPENSSNVLQDVINTSRVGETQPVGIVSAVNADSTAVAADVGNGTGSRRRRKRTRQISDSQTVLLQPSSGLDSSNGSNASVMMTTHTS